MAKSAGKIYVGMSGWTFDGWKGAFYPKDLSKAKELGFASRQVNSIEVNGTFYSLQKPATFARWHDETPDDFCFAIKAPKYITLVRRLKEVDEPLATFFASGLFCLKDKLGPILWQFPPNVMLKDDRFEKFLKLLPHDSKSASRLAKKHSPRFKDRVHTRVHGDFPIRHAFEFRHPSFKNPKFIELLRKHGVAVVFAHSGMKSPYMEDLTADFVYARMHGQDSQFKKGYPDKFIGEWAERVLLWTRGRQPRDAELVSEQSPKLAKRDAFVFFDTEAKVHAPEEAMALVRKLGLGQRLKAKKAA
jgi:uncharacterized protein YecE (DUF72 family)